MQRTVYGDHVHLLIFSSRRGGGVTVEGGGGREGRKMFWPVQPADCDHVRPATVKETRRWIWEQGGAGGGGKPWQPQVRGR